MASEGLSFEIQDSANSIEKPLWQPDEIWYEDFERYCQGGYCPITLYQELKDKRYSIEYKLGHGIFATVWLARDTHSLNMRHVALKVLTADSTANSSEAQLLSMLKATDFQASPGSTYVVNILDEFEITSINGNHRVFVMPVTRGAKTLSSPRFSFRSVVKSLLKGLDTIHSAGIVHGDIHPGNIGYRFDIPYPSDYFPPQLAVLPPNDHQPPYLVSCESWRERPDPPMWEDITGRFIPIILDFGNAYHLSDLTPRGGNSNAIADHYIPPEHIFGKPELLNQKTDIWAFGALIYELGTDSCLVGSESKRKDSLLCINDQLAPEWTIIPKDQTVISRFWTESFEKLKTESQDVGDEQVFKDFLLGMVALDPNKRVSAKDLLNHPYLSDVSFCVEMSS